MKVVRTIEVEVDGLGSRIEAARRDSGKTVTATVNAIGMSAQNWYRIIKDEQSMNEELLRKIEAALGVDFGVSFDECEG